ncbi:hypothetical protein BLNAU_16078 [Blattamonas nauphoetae]|uniref:Uncharacterized protein n=1 Tax=Blattamonas nauphoetae TaxID=2049346 RepID=A0ABQ9XE87_9EUKA|nr:hypothetical protein BLNAU_16078 [Blattamonas nauphoetae]
MGLRVVRPASEKSKEFREFLRNRRIPTPTPTNAKQTRHFLTLVTERLTTLAETLPASPALPSDEKVLEGKEAECGTRAKAALSFLSNGVALLHRLVLDETSFCPDMVVDLNLVPSVRVVLEAALQHLPPPPTPSQPTTHPSSTQPSPEVARLLEQCWKTLADCVTARTIDLSIVVESTFADVGELVEMVMRTSEVAKAGEVREHVRMLGNLVARRPFHRLDMVKGQIVSSLVSSLDLPRIGLSRPAIHQHMLRLIFHLLRTPRSMSEEDKSEHESLRMANVFAPAFPFLSFVVRHESVLGSAGPDRAQLGKRVSSLYRFVVRAWHLEGQADDVVESGHEEWEVEWLTNMEHDKTLAKRLLVLDKGERRTRKTSTKKWGHRQREARKAGWDDGLELRRVGGVEGNEAGLLSILDEFGKRYGLNVLERDPDADGEEADVREIDTEQVESGVEAESDDDEIDL